VLAEEKGSSDLIWLCLFAFVCNIDLNYAFWFCVLALACSTISFLLKDVKALDDELDKLKAEKSDLQDQFLGIRSIMINHILYMVSCLNW
jgi:hypothetical protein